MLGVSPVLGGASVVLYMAVSEKPVDIELLFAEVNEAIKGECTAKSKIYIFLWSVVLFGVSC